MVNHCVCVGCTTLICEDILYYVFPDRKRKAGACTSAFGACMKFVQVKRRDFTVTSATKCVMVVCDAQVKQTVYLPFPYMWRIYNLLLLKPSIRLHISLAGAAGSNCSSDS